MTLCTIGWIEARDVYLQGQGGWQGVVPFGFCAMEYDALSWLFGARDRIDFPVLAESRGLPRDVFQKIRRQAKSKSCYGGHSWVSWHELKALDWEETTLDWNHYGGPNVLEEWREELERSAAEPDREEGKTWIDGNLVYQQVRITRKDTLDRPFTVLFDLMEALAKTCGDENVRMIVWFDD